MYRILRLLRELSGEACDRRACDPEYERLILKGEVRQSFKGEKRESAYDKTIWNIKKGKNKISWFLGIRKDLMFPKFYREKYRILIANSG